MSSKTAAKALDEFRHHFSIQLRWGDVDRLGHVNNTKFFKFTECSRTHYMRSLLADDIVPGLWVDCGLILAEIQCTFRQPVFHPGELLLGTSFTLGNKSAAVHTNMFLPENREQPVATSSGTVVWYDYQKNGSAPFPESIREVINEFEANGQRIQGR